MRTRAKLLTVMLFVPFAVVGCASVTPNNPSSTTGTNMTGMNMTGMNMTSQTSGQTLSANDALRQAFTDELTGFTTIQSDIHSGNYSAAVTLANNLHDEFHAAILPPLTQVKGSVYAESVHSKYDALQEAITQKDTVKIDSLVKQNRDNLYIVAKILGVTVK